MPKTGYYQKKNNGAAAAAAAREYKYAALSGIGGRPQQQQTTSHQRDERDIVSEMNQMYKHSPFMQRRCEVSSGTNDNGSSCVSTQPLPPTVIGNAAVKESIYNNLGEALLIVILLFIIILNLILGVAQNKSPFLQRKHGDGVGFWNVQPTSDTGGGGDFIAASGAVPSPHMGRKRFQTTIPVADSSQQHPPQQYSRPQGSTSPIGESF